MQMARDPWGDWTISDVQAVCGHNGLGCEPPRGGGSHYKVVGGGFRLTIPRARRVKPIYIKALLGLIRRIRDQRA